MRTARSPYLCSAEQPECMGCRPWARGIHSLQHTYMLQVLERVFVDTRHAASGFYLLRFFHDDPRSDDDWKVTALTLTLTLALALALT